MVSEFLWGLTDLQVGLDRICWFSGVLGLSWALFIYPEPLITVALLLHSHRSTMTAETLSKGTNTKNFTAVGHVIN